MNIYLQTLLAILLFTSEPISAVRYVLTTPGYEGTQVFDALIELPEGWTLDTLRLWLQHQRWNPALIEVQTDNRILILFREPVQAMWVRGLQTGRPVAVRFARTITWNLETTRNWVTTNGWTLAQPIGFHQEEDAFVVMFTRVQDAAAAMQNYQHTQVHPITRTPSTQPFLVSGSSSI